MGTLNVIYVRATEAADIDIVRKKYPSAYDEDGSPFLGVKQPDSRFLCPESELQGFSALLNTDVIWLSFQSAVDAFQYHYWRQGNPVRSLVYGCFKNEREWERVDGTPQTWEAEVLFGDLEGVLEDQTSDDDRHEIERIYQGHEIKAGAVEPSLDAREVARGIAQFYGFPGWSLKE